MLALSTAVRARDGHIGPVRLARAAHDLRRGPATGQRNAGQVAAPLGDRSEKMGTHYTRNVESATKVVHSSLQSQEKAG